MAEAAAAAVARTLSKQRLTLSPQRSDTSSSLRSYFDAAGVTVGCPAALSQLLGSKDAEILGLQQQLQQATEDLRRNLEVRLIT